MQVDLSSRRAAVVAAAVPPAPQTPMLRAAGSQHQDKKQDNKHQATNQPVVHPAVDQPEHVKAKQQSPSHHLRIWSPKFRLLEVKSINGVCRMMRECQAELRPAQWVTGFVQVVTLVARGQQVPAAGWQVLRSSITYLTDDQQQQQQGAVASEARSAAPICSFKPQQTAVLLWAVAKLGLQLPDAAWPTLLAHVHNALNSNSSSGGGGGGNGSSSRMSPRHAALTLWALSRLQPPVPVGWAVQPLLDGCSSSSGGGGWPLQAYSCKSLVLLLYSLVRLDLRVTPAWQRQLVATLAARLQKPGHHSSSSSNSSSSSSSSRWGIRDTFSAVDLSLLVWALPGLHITPPAAVLTALLAASRPQLSVMGCAELTALLVGVGRLRFVPPGAWLLEAYDQLYWSVDQLSLRQLVGVVWALGRLRLVAVPPELLERLLRYIHVRLQQQQQQQGVTQQQQQDGTQQQQQQQQQTLPDPFSVVSGRQAVRRKGPVAGRTCQHTSHTRLLSLLLTGLCGLSPQLGSTAQQQCGSWLLQVLDCRTAAAGRQVAGSLHAAARLRVVLQGAAERAAVFAAVSDLQEWLGLDQLAVAVWGAVAVAGSPSDTQLLQWLDRTRGAVVAAGVPALHMMLHACVCAQQLPGREWWLVVTGRLQQLVCSMTGRNCVFLSQLLVDVVLLQQRHQQQQEQWAVAPAAAGSAAAEEVVDAAAVASSVRLLLLLLSKRVEQLEVQQHISAKSLQNFEGNRQQLALLMTP